MQFRPPSQPGWGQSEPEQQPFPQQQTSYTQPQFFQTVTPPQPRPPVQQPPKLPLKQPIKVQQKPPMTPKQRDSLGLKIGCGVLIAVLALVIIVAVNVANYANQHASSTGNNSSQTNTSTTQVAQYPPTTQADLRGLAAQGDASAIQEFHSESVGLVGACPQPKREVTVSPSVTGQQLAEDLLAYFYGQQLDSPCGSVVFAYHTQSEAAGDGYTAGRILFDANDSNGQGNLDPNATNLKYTLTLDTGDVITGQEYVVTY